MILLTHVLEFYVTIFNESLYPSQKDGNDESPPLAETLFSVDLSSFDGHDCLRYPWRWTEDNYFSSRLQIIWQSTITSSLTFDRFAVSQCIISLRVPSWPWNSVVSTPYRNRICPVSVFAGRSLSSCISQCSTLTTREITPAGNVAQRYCTCLSTSKFCEELYWSGMKQVFGQSDVSLQMLRPKFCRKKRRTDPIQSVAILSEFCRSGVTSLKDSGPPVDSVKTFRF